MTKRKAANKENVTLLSSIGSALQKFFDVIKKPVDSLDDIWPGFRVLLPKKIIAAVGPYIMGGAGVIVHLGEALKNLKIFVNSLRDENHPQRKTNIGTSFFGFMFEGVGFGLSIALIAGAAGAKVLGQVFMPSIMTGLLTGTYALALIRKIYTFHVVKQEEAAAVSPEDQKKTREKRLVAERKLAYAALEFTNTAVIFAGTLLLTGIFIATSTISLGTLPAALALGGAITASLCNIFKYFDKKNDYRYSASIRAWAVDTYHALFSPAKNRRHEVDHNKQNNTDTDIKNTADLQNNLKQQHALQKDKPTITFSPPTKTTPEQLRHDLEQLGDKTPPTTPARDKAHCYFWTNLLPWRIKRDAQPAVEVESIPQSPCIVSK